MNRGVPTRLPRRAFTIMELVVALAGLALGLTLVLELAMWSTAERRRLLVRGDALEAAANVLEAAQAASYDGLTSEWAAAQQLPTSLAPRLYNGRWTVRVEPEPAPLKRVTVEIAWQGSGIDTGQPVRLSGWFGPRTSGAKGRP